MERGCCSPLSAVCRLVSFLLDSLRLRKSRDQGDSPGSRDPITAPGDIESPATSLPLISTTDVNNQRSTDVVIERRQDGVHISFTGGGGGSSSSSGGGISSPAMLSPPVSDADKVLLSTLDTRVNRPLHSGRFLTLHKRRRKRLNTRQLAENRALLDDIYHGPVKLVLERIDRWHFNAFTLDTVCGGRSVPVLCVHLFKEFGLIRAFNLDVVKVWKCFSLIEESYHNSNPYHNSIHAADVTQAMYCYLREPMVMEHLTPLEVMAAILGAVCHDLDHPGVNQPFLIATANHLATLYKNSSVLENHHWRMAAGCVIDSGMLSHLERSRFTDLMTQIRSLILATDIARQGEFISRFQDFMATSSLDLCRSAHRHFILQIALKCADISNPCRNWDISNKWSRKVCDEFYRQGDYERKLNLPLTSLCDRMSSSVAKIQVGFFRHVVRPLFYEWNRWLNTPLSREMMSNLESNHARWERCMQQETEEETKTEMSDTEPSRVEEPTDDDVSDVSESELRELLTVPAHTSRRHSAPVFFPRPLARTIIRRESLPAEPPRRLRTETILHMEHREGYPSLVSVCSLSSLRVPEEEEGDVSDVSAENLLPDPSIASITAGGSVSPLSGWSQSPNRDRNCGSISPLSTRPPSEAVETAETTGDATASRLERQRTFPVTEPGDASRVRYLSLPVRTPPLGTPAPPPQADCGTDQGCGTPPVPGRDRRDAVAQLRAFHSVLCERVNTHRRLMARHRPELPRTAAKENRQPPPAGPGLQRAALGRRSVGGLSDLLRRRGSAPVKFGWAQEVKTLARNSSFTEERWKHAGTVRRGSLPPVGDKVAARCKGMKIEPAWCDRKDLLPDWALPLRRGSVPSQSGGDSEQLSQLRAALLLRLRAVLSAEAPAAAPEPPPCQRRGSLPTDLIGLCSPR